MQTQSILQSMMPVSSQVKANAPGKASKADKAAFDSFMSKDASKEMGSSDRLVVKQAGNDIGKNTVDVKSSQDSMNQNKISLIHDGDSKGMTGQTELEETETMVVQLLQDTFGMSEEDVVDVLEQLGLAPIDLAFLLMPGPQITEVQPTPVENIKAFIMEVHGVEDANLFLVSDRMSDEFSTLMTGIQDILSQQLGIDINDLSQDDVRLLQDFAETAAQRMDDIPETTSVEQLPSAEPSEEAVQYAEQLVVQEEAVEQTDIAKPATEQKIPIADRSQMKQDVVPEETVQSTAREVLNTAAPNVVQNATEDTVSGQSEDEVVSTAGISNDIPVVVEVSEESGTSNQMFQNDRQSLSGDVKHETEGRLVENPLNTFVERLTESFEAVREERTVMTGQTTMEQIVEQVVNHVRIRVLPQTTSMELQLNPASLGRVNLNVTSQNGVATATLTVQNQVAKEALESQITVLRENLESQGLKVDAVEVNVSEFGFKHPEDSNNQQFKQKKSSQGRNIRFDAAGDVEEQDGSAEAERMTAADRRDENSVVDYTA